MRCEVNNACPPLFIVWSCTNQLITGTLRIVNYNTFDIINLSSFMLQPIIKLNKSIFFRTFSGWKKQHMTNFISWLVRARLSRLTSTILLNDYPGVYAQKIPCIKSCTTWRHYNNKNENKTWLDLILIYS